MIKKGRPIGRSEGLIYFPLDVNYADNDKIKELFALYGRDGMMFPILLWCSIYKKSYYKKWDARSKRRFCLDWHYDEKLADDILTTCIELELFSAELFEKHEVLTSSKAQEVFFEGAHRRKSVNFIQEYLLIDLDSYVEGYTKNVTLVNLEGATVSIKKPKPGRPSAKKTTPPDQPSLDFNTGAIDDPDRLNGNELRLYVKAPYESRSETFRNTYTEIWYNSYITFSKKIIDNYDNLLDSSRQITIKEYLKLFSGADIDPKPTLLEVDWSLKKMSATGLKSTNAQIYLRFIDFIGYMRSDKAKEEGKDGSNKSSVAKVKDDSYLYDTSKGINKLKKKKMLGNSNQTNTPD